MLIVLSNVFVDINVMMLLVLMFNVLLEKCNKYASCYVLPALAASVLVSILAHRLCLSLQESTFPALVTLSRNEHQFACSRPRRSADARHPGGAVDVQVVRVSLTQSLLNLIIPSSRVPLSRNHQRG